MTPAQPPTGKDDGKTLADLNPDLNKDQAMAEVLAEIAASDPDNAKLLAELSDKDSATAQRIALNVRLIQQAIQENLKAAEKEGVRATVATDNTQALLGLLTELVGDERMREILRAARLTDEAIERLLTGRVYITLEEFNRVMETVWLAVGTKDAPLLGAAYLVEHDFGPLRQVIPSAQKTLSIPALYFHAPGVSWLFNKVKDMKRIRGGATWVEFTSTIVPAIPAMQDYWSRYFVYSIVAGAMSRKVLAHLERCTGLTAADLRQQVAAARSGNRPDWDAVPPGISGAAVTEGLYQYWRSQNPELVRQYNLPRKLTADLTERWLQFPLDEALEFHAELARDLGLAWPVEAVREKDGVLFAAVDGRSVQLAHRVKLLRRGKKFSWRELEPGESPAGLPLHVDFTIPWCYSEEYARAISVCEVGQLWGMPTSSWRLNWTNPRVPLGIAVKQFGQLGLTNLRRGPGALVAIGRSLWERQKAVKAALAHARREHREMRERTSQLTGAIVRAMLAGESAVGGWMQQVEQLFQERLDQVSRGHIQRVQDLGAIRQARAAGYGLADFHGLISNEPTEAEAARCAVDEHYRRTREAIQLRRRAAKIHDYGKMIVPERDLNFPDKPDKTRGRRIQMHVGFTEIIGRALYSDDPDAVKIASRHHEHLDGSGYLNRLTAVELDFHDRGLAVDDRYDAMRGPRPYRNPQSMLRLLVFQIIKRDAGIKLDGWQVRDLFETALWLRTSLSPLSAETLKGFGLSEEMVTYLHQVESAEVTAEELAIVAELQQKFPTPDPTAPPPWDQ